MTGPTVAEALGALYAAEHAATIQAHAVRSVRSGAVVLGCCSTPLLVAVTLCNIIHSL